MQGVKAPFDRCRKQRPAGSAFGAENSDHVLGGEPAPLTLQPGVPESPSPIARLDGDCNPQSESALVLLYRMVRIELMFSNEMADVDGLEYATTQSTRDVLHTFAGLLPLHARHAQILGKGRPDVSG